MPKISLLKYSVIIFLLTITVIVRLSFDQFVNYAKGLNELEGGYKTKSIIWFDAVLNAHIPFSPLEVRSRSKLKKLSEDFEKEKEYELALLCLESIRSASYLTRHIVIPYSEEIENLNKKIANLKAVILVQEGDSRDILEEYNKQLAILSRDFSPSTIWSICSISAFVLFLMAVFMWIWCRQKRYSIIATLLFMFWAFSLIFV